MKEQKITKMEFLLTVNDKIIVQRFFNVMGYRHENRNSMEVYDLVNQIRDSIQHDLKMKTVVYMLENQELIESNPEVMNTSMTDGPEKFNIFVKVNEKTICHRQFDAKLFPPKVRYTVDVRPHIKNILSSLTDIFSADNLTFEYLGLTTNV
jgi:hypothetical protein